MTNNIKHEMISPLSKVDVEHLRNFMVETVNFIVNKADEYVKNGIITKDDIKVVEMSTWFDKFYNPKCQEFVSLQELSDDVNRVLLILEKFTFRLSRHFEQNTNQETTTEYPKNYFWLMFILLGFRWFFLESQNDDSSDKSFLVYNEKTGKFVLAEPFSDKQYISGILDTIKGNKKEEPPSTGVMPV